MSTYDDKIDELLITRKRHAEERKAMRRRQCIMQVAYICIAVCVVIILIVGIKKIFGGKSDDNAASETSAITTTTATADDADATDDEESSETTDSEDFTGMTVYCTTSVNLRAESNTDSDILTVISAGESVEVVEQGEEWCKVSYGDQEGYLKLEYLSDNYEE